MLHAGQAQLDAGGAAHVLGLEGVRVVAEGGHHLRLPQEADVLLLGGQVQGMIRGHLLAAVGNGATKCIIRVSPMQRTIAALMDGIPRQEFFSKRALRITLQQPWS